MRILFVKLSSIGDVVHTLPTLNAVKTAIPESKVSWAVEKSTAEILRHNTLIENLYELDTRSIRRPSKMLGELASTRRRFSHLRSKKFDLCIDFQGLLKSALIARISKSSRRIGFSGTSLREGAAARFYNRGFDFASKQNVILKNVALAEAALRLVTGQEQLELPRRPLEFPIETTREHVLEAEALVENFADDFVVLNPAGGWPTKLWPAENYGQLANSLHSEFGIKSFISVGPGEEELGQRAMEVAESGVASVVTPTLKGFYELVKRARCYIGGDTAPTHLAVAANCPVIGIFGPTEWWRNGSPREEDLCVARKDIDCRTNCHRRSCDQWICMDIDVSEVMLAFKQRLGL